MKSEFPLDNRWLGQEAVALFGQDTGPLWKASCIYSLCLKLVALELATTIKKNMSLKYRFQK